MSAFVALLAWCACAEALNPSLDISEYEHTAWTVRDGFALGNIYCMAQSPDGYLWFGTEFGLFRFDGVQSSAWQSPAGQQIPGQAINSLLFTRDGTLWIGAFGGLVTLKDGKLTPRPEMYRHFVSSLFEDREGAVWVGTLGSPGGLLAIRNGSGKRYGEDGAFGRAVWAMHEDSSGTLWAAAQSGLWRIKPGPPKRYPTPTELIGLTEADDGKLLVALHGAGLLRLAEAADRVKGSLRPQRTPPLTRFLACRRISNIGVKHFLKSPMLEVLWSELHARQSSSGEP
jgi:ligand-binding sensor domain-containing protein